MDLFALVLYGGVNLWMVLHHLGGRGRYNQFPFWIGMIALGWFYPQAIGGYVNVERFPPNAYADGMLFASLCTIAVWVGFDLALKRKTERPSWLDAGFDEKKLYYAGAGLCLFGFFFQWKLWSLPEELLAQTQWSGATVKYLFFASVFKIGFITLWLSYLRQSRWVVWKYLVFIIPCFLLFFEAAVLRGRRAGMMELASYLVISLWFVKRWSAPRWVIVSGLVAGLIFINAIGTYRAIMKKKELSLSQRLTLAANADYVSKSMERLDESGMEFKNYIYYRQVHVDEKFYDFGLTHWNQFVFNYVPAQLIGKKTKESLYIKLNDLSMSRIAKERYGHSFHIGTTLTGYKDAFGSFGWLGFVKFLIIGAMMGMLYRRAMQGAFLGQLLYVYFLTKAMQTVSHGTNDILVRVWVYFLVLGYPVLYWARRRPVREVDFKDGAHPSGVIE
jgi:hypothetical protein